MRLSTLNRKSFRQFVNGFKALRYQSRFKVIFVSCFAAFCEVGLFLLFMVGFRVLDMFGGIGGFIVGRLFSLFFLGIGMMLVVSSLVTSYATFFRSDEVPFLMTRPFTTSQIVTYKFFETVFFASWAFFFIVLPYVGAYAWHEGLPLHFAVWTLLFSFPFLTLCSGIGAISVLLIVRWVPRGRAWRLLIAGVIAIVVAGAWIYTHEVYDPAADARLNLSRVIPGVMLASNILLPNTWVAEGIMSLTRGEWLRGIMMGGLLLSSAIVMFMVVEWLGSHLLYECWQRTMMGSSNRTGEGRFFPVMEVTLRPLAPDIRAIVMKDVKTFFRDPVQWSQVLVFFGLLALYFANLGSFDYSVLGGYWVNMMAFLNVFSVSAVICSLGARFIYPQLSLEGQGFWILGLSPTSMRRIVLAKFGVALAGMLSVSVLLMLLSATMLGTALPVRITAVGLACVVSFAVCGLSIGLGAIFIDLKQRNPAAIVSGFGGTLNLVLTLGFMLAVILPFGLIFHLHATGRIVMHELWRGLVIAAVWATLLGGGFTVVPLALGIRSLRRRDF